MGAWRLPASPPLEALSLRRRHCRLEILTTGGSRPTERIRPARFHHAGTQDLGSATPRPPLSPRDKGTAVQGHEAKRGSRGQEDVPAVEGAGTPRLPTAQVPIHQAASLAIITTTLQQTQSPHVSAAVSALCCPECLAESHRHVVPPHQQHQQLPGLDDMYVTGQ
jgi:hypothetical protein